MNGPSVRGDLRGGLVKALSAAFVIVGLAGCAVNQYEAGARQDDKTVPVASSVSHTDPFVAGRAAMAEGDTTAASIQFGLALQLDPNDPAALNNLAVAKANEGDYLGALDILRRALANAPGRADIAANLASLQRWYNQRSNVSLESPSLDSVPIDSDMAEQTVPRLWGSVAGDGADRADMPLVPGVGPQR